MCVKHNGAKNRPWHWKFQTRRFLRNRPTKRFWIVLDTRSLTGLSFAGYLGINWGLWGSWQLAAIGRQTRIAQDGCKGSISKRFSTFHNQLHYDTRCLSFPCVKRQRLCTFEIRKTKSLFWNLLSLCWLAELFFKFGLHSS